MENPNKEKVKYLKGGSRYIEPSLIKSLGSSTHQLKCAFPDFIGLEKRKD